MFEYENLKLACYISEYITQTPIVIVHGGSCNVIKAMLLANAGTAVYSTGLANDWTSTRSLQGSLQKVVYNKFNSEKTLSIGGGVSISATVKIK